ncbi:MAG: sterol desaturase family protein [Bacteroidia bacterium]
MNDFKISNTGTGTIFRNKFLEGLTRTRFSFPVILYFVIAAVILGYGLFFENVKPLKIIYLFPLGMISFTLFEYLTHRFVFHFHAETEKEKIIQYTIHGIHHEFPKDKDRLVMPPLVTIFIAVIFFFVFLLTMKENAWFFYSGFVATYSVYLLIHFAVHRFHPPKNFFKILWKHHALHHYKSTDGYYSVSLPFWDYLFGTTSHGKQDKILENKLPDVI